MITIVTAHILLAANAAQVSDVIPTRMIEEAGFTYYPHSKGQTKGTPGELGYRIMYYFKNDPIAALSVESERTDEYTMQSTFVVSAYGWKPTPATLPSWKKVAFMSDNDAECLAYGGLFSVRVRIGFPASRKTNIYDNINTPEYRHLAESVCRHTLASLYGKFYLQPAPSVNVDGSSYASLSFKTPPSNRPDFVRPTARWIKLADWARNHDVTVTYGDMTAEYVYRGERYLLPLASDQFKKGAAWFRASGPILKRGDDWLIPKDLPSKRAGGGKKVK